MLKGSSHFLPYRLYLIALVAAAALISDLILPDAVFAANDGWWNGTDPGEFKDGIIRDVYCDLLGYMEGSFGGLLTTIAGVYAFGMAAIGNIKHFFAALTVALASFSMSAGISISFGEMCNNRQSAAPAAPTPAAGSRILSSDFLSSSSFNPLPAEKTSKTESSQGSDPFQTFE